MFKIIKRVEYTFQEVLRIMYTKNQERINHLWEGWFKFNIVCC